MNLNNFENKIVLITGVAGFIGSYLAKELLESANCSTIIGIDNMNSYYDVKLKKHRISELINRKNFIFIEGDISNKELITTVFNKYRPQIVVNLAAQAGVRYSISNPDAYIQSNIIGFYNILEACRFNRVEHLIFASSSSVYGSNKDFPYRTSDKTDTPVSLYAATKKSNELFAYSYSKLYGIPCTGLRFFTVYGPAGRPDMAYFDFTNKLYNNENISVFNYGNCKRDFTFIDDIINGICMVMSKIPDRDENGVLYKVYNIGNNKPENLIDFINILYEELKVNNLLPIDFDLKEHLILKPMQPGDVEVTYADIDDMKKDFNFMPKTTLRQGINSFIKWYKEYYILKEGEK